MEKQKHTLETPLTYVSSGAKAGDIEDADGCFVARMVATDEERPHPLEHSQGARIVACVNACAGLNPDAIAGVVAALERSVESMELARTGASVSMESIDAARDALAKLQG